MCVEFYLNPQKTLCVCLEKETPPQEEDAPVDCGLPRQEKLNKQRKSESPEERAREREREEGWEETRRGPKVLESILKNSDI